MKTADDTRRELEATGLRSADRYPMIRAVLDAYSEAFESSRKEARHHEQALLEAVVAATPYIVASAMEVMASRYPESEFPETADEIARCAAAGITLDGIQAMAIRERLLAEAKQRRGEQS